MKKVKEAEPEAVEDVATEPETKGKKGKAKAEPAKPEKKAKGKSKAETVVEVVED